ncbi:hypothetical protein JCM10213_003054 [Rhodosporidiobolus nylandii]
MDSLGGFYDPTSSTPRPSTPSSASSTPVPARETSAPKESAQSAAPAAQQLEKEVQNVMSGLGSFWGKVRKQATAAAATAEAQYSKAQKDLTPFLSKAQQQLDTLSAQTKAELARLSETPQQQGQGGVVIGADGVLIVMDEPVRAPAALAAKEDVKGKGVDPAERGAVDEAQQAAAAEQTPAAAASAFLRSLSSRASAASAPQLQALQKDLSSLRSGLSTNLEHLQSQLGQLNVGEELQQTGKLAEGYLHKGESWFAEFSAEVGKLAKEAVRVVPPVPGNSSPTQQTQGRQAGSGVAVTQAVGRKVALLYRLRTDPSLLLADPALPPTPSSDAKDVREAYAAFVASLQQSTLDGFGTPVWGEKVAAELAEGGEGLAKTLRELTEQGEMSEEAFWTRYFFRKQEIEEEEGRRRRVLQGAAAEQSDDDFSWDMDDEESSASVSSPPPSTTAAPLSTPAPPAASSSAAPQPEKEKEISPRASSETTTASYDVVGEKSGNPSEGEASEEEAAPLAKAVKAGEKEIAKGGEAPPVAAAPAPVKKAEEKDEESEDSDWE